MEEKGDGEGEISIKNDSGLLTEVIIWVIAGFIS